MASSIEPLRDKFGNTIPAFRQGPVQNVAYTATQGRTAVVQSKLICVVCSTDAYVFVGPGTPTATASNGSLVGAFAEKWFVTEPGVSRVSAIRLSADGVMSVTEAA